ncbi:protein FAR-RED IMPAIRED RESPONSE 1-like [Chenopodium quinoa]|uniref:protein FAR-RED IMPAIRED RESPONSE 1-like n=1 Tax=Chenopodium quinoa TaxID=63459 RepID=UPI000B78822F|nr:protein FAR-RED IMPAIRED RESPONSE 1-like [Chenopodium quinoa]
MGGKAPVLILTDQDPAIRKAVNLTMPESCHRWCIWHILQKFGRYVGKHEDYEAVNDEFENIIYGSLDADELVDRWVDAVDYYKLGDNSWLEEYAKPWHNYETVNVPFTGVQVYKVRAESERIADSNTLRYIKHVATDFPAEEVFQKCYTNAKFKEVQQECKRMLYVRRLDYYEVGENQVDVSFVPEKYILRRWRKDIQRKHTRVKVAYHDPLKTEKARQYHKLMGMYEPICSKASACKEGVEAVAKLLQLMDLRADEVLAMVAKKQEHAAKDNENEEKKGKEKAARAKNAAKKQAAAAKNNMSLSMNDYVRSIGKIQMRDVDDSLGYFTSVRGTNSGGFFASVLGTLGTSDCSCNQGGIFLAYVGFEGENNTDNIVNYCVCVGCFEL